MPRGGKIITKINEQIIKQKSVEAIFQGQLYDNCKENTLQSTERET